MTNKFVLFGAIAAAALVIPSVASSLMLEEAYAQRAGDVEQSANAIQRSGDNLVNAQVAVPANVNVQVTDVNACIIVEDCD
jgi:broad specificity polyphosphatase/5'/3'-nucleotidase SurE